VLHRWTEHYHDVWSATTDENKVPQTNHFEPVIRCIIIVDGFHFKLFQKWVIGSIIHYCWYKYYFSNTMHMLRPIWGGGPYDNGGI
jgi:hypothetical protein